MAFKQNNELQPTPASTLIKGARKGKSGRPKVFKDEMRPIRTTVTLDQYSNLKILAGIKGVSITEYLREQVNSILETQENAKILKEIKKQQLN